MSNQIEEVEILARLVLKLSDTTEFIEKKVAELPSRDDAGFLHSQLDTVLRELQKALQTLEEHRSGGSNGLFGKLFGKQRSSEEAIPKAKLLGLASAIPVSELVNFLSSSRKTGILWVFGEHETYLLELLEGSLVHATSDKTPADMMLGEILVRKGLLRRQELKVLLRRARDAGEVFGSYLVDEDRVSGKQLREVLSFQIQGLFDRLMGEGEAIYRFHEGEPLKCAAELDLNITQLLLESARSQDEATKLGEAA